MTDTELLDWLEKQQGSALLSDDHKLWAVSGTGWNPVPMSAVGEPWPPDEWVGTHVVEKDQPSIREAIIDAHRRWQDRES